MSENNPANPDDENYPPPAKPAQTPSPPSRFSSIDDHDARLMVEEEPTSTPRQKAAVSLDQVSIADPDSYKQRISSAGLTQEIIDSFSPETVLESSTSALPGGIGRAHLPYGSTREEITVEDLFGFELPSKRVTDYLLNVYLGAVHWFMMVFHEPTLRLSYEGLMAHRSCPRSRSNQAIFILLLLSLGAHYASEDEVRQKFPSFNLQTFQRLSLKRIEDSLHGLYDAAELESVQVCILLGSYYMYHGRPNLAFAVLGSGLSCAQLMSLHKESSWRWLSDIAKEERRRTFWALFVFDRFASTIFGRPCGIPLNSIEVKIPENIGDTTVQHPRFRSTAKMPDGTVEAVTTFSYMKYKFKLYQISSPIISDLYFHRSGNVSELAIKVSRINEELVSWFNSLPPELKLEDLFRDPNEPVTPSTRPFMLQALALQIAYDNVQILLHRPLLSQDLRKFKGSTGDGDAETTPMHSYSREVHRILISSRDHCWDSAIRSSRLGRYQQCLASARESHACAFLGINLFTAGMVLCVVALSRPLSSQAQMAKQAVSRIMTLSRFLSGKALLSAQTTKILKDLVHLIGEKEIKAMLSGGGMADHAGQSDDVSCKRHQQRQHQQQHQQQHHPQQTDVSAAVAASPGSTTTTQYPAISTLQTPMAATTRSGTDGPLFFYHEESVAGHDNFDFTGFESMDFNNGIVTLQQAMFPASTVATPDAVYHPPPAALTSSSATSTSTVIMNTTTTNGTTNTHTNGNINTTTNTSTNPTAPQDNLTPWSRTRDEYNAQHAYLNHLGGTGHSDSHSQSYGQSQSQSQNQSHGNEHRNGNGNGSGNGNTNSNTNANPNPNPNPNNIIGETNDIDNDDADADADARIDILASTDFSMMNSVGQTWLWDTMSW